MFSQLLLLAAAAVSLPLTAAAPTSKSIPSRTIASPRTTHSVVAGRPGLRFDPENIFAEVGSIIEFHFLPANHTVVEAAFDAPCVPKGEEAFYGGFFPVAKKADGSVAQSPEVFQIEVKDDKPIWFYCGQPKGAHCQAGMVGSVNQRVDSGKTLEAFRAAAAAVQGDAVVPAQPQGGWRGANPNPLGGF